MYSSLQVDMSGIKRKIEGNDPDYEDISLAQNSKRNKATEHNGKMSLCSEPWEITPALALHVMTAMDKLYSICDPCALILSFILFYFICQLEKQQSGRLKPS